MARYKPITDDELVRAMVRAEDMRETALDLARRINGAVAIELPQERACMLAMTATALTALAVKILEPPAEPKQPTTESP